MDVQKTIDRIVQIVNAADAPTKSGFTLVQQLAVDRLMKTLLHRKDAMHGSDE